MSRGENKAVIRRYFQEVLPQVRDGDLAATDALLTNDAAFQEIPADPRRLVAQPRNNARPCSSAPCLMRTSASRRWCLGGVAAGIPATRQLVRMTGTTIYHVLDGRIAEARSNLAQSGLAQQLGAIPSGPGAPVGDHS